MTNEQATAREAIRHTMSVYNNSGDRGRLEDLAGAFLKDGVLETPFATFKGRQAIIDGLAQGVKARNTPSKAAPFSFVRHNLTTSRIEFVSADEAEAWTYFIVFTDIGPDHMGTYTDRFRKTGEDWLIEHRRVKIDWRSPQSTWHARSGTNTAL